MPVTTTPEAQRYFNQGLVLAYGFNHAEAEAVYREDLDYFAENGWSLHGLAQSLRAQGRDGEASTVQWRFERAWQHADMQLARLSTPSSQ